MKTLLWILGIALVIFLIYYFWKSAKAKRVLTFRETIEGALPADPGIGDVNPGLNFNNTI